MLHHISFAVSDLNKSALFYDATLNALGFKRVYVAEKFIGYGHKENEDLFAIVAKSKDVTAPSSGFHLAFSAPNRIAVDTFRKAAVANGGTDNGAPGLRPQYGPDYYAAFVVDPDGYRLEAVYKG